MYTIFCMQQIVCVDGSFWNSHTHHSCKAQKCTKNYLSLVDFVYNRTWITVPDQCPFTTETMRVKQYAQIANIFWENRVAVARCSRRLHTLSSHFRRIFPQEFTYLFVRIYKVRAEWENPLCMFSVRCSVAYCCVFHSMETSMTIYHFEQFTLSIYKRAFSIVNKLFVWMNAERNSNY